MVVYNFGKTHTKKVSYKIVKLYTCIQCIAKVLLLFEKIKTAVFTIYQALCSYHILTVNPHSNSEEVGIFITDILF